MSLSSSFAFLLQDSITRTITAKPRVAGRRTTTENTNTDLNFPTVALVSMHLIPEHHRGGSTASTSTASSAETGTRTRTRIHMAGPVLDDENSVLNNMQMQSFGKHSGLAHGILCPETVSKMDELTQGGRSNRAVKAFLDRYRRCGPMSCMELLSDPEILPHLTKTMRHLA